MTNSAKKHRVVVTGLGVISSLGIGWEDFWKNLLAGKSGISRVRAFDTSEHDRSFAGEVKNFDPLEFMSKREAQKLGRASQMAMAATKLALKDAHIKLKDLPHFKKAAVCIGTTNGENNVLEDMNINKHHTNRNPKFNAKRNADFLPTNLLSTAISKKYKLTGSNLVFGTACAAGNYAIGNAYDLLQHGLTDMAIAGGTDGLSRITYTGFGRIYAIAPEKCQPFDLNRKGMIPGEGSGILILETLENAKKRNVPIYGEILGYGLCCDGNHMTNPDPRVIARGLEKALKSSTVHRDQINYISAHGTGTTENDLAECSALEKVFGPLIQTIPISSIKSMLGHTMGAAAALETIVCCLVTKFNEIPPTINLENQDPLCKINCVPNKSIKRVTNVALNNSLAFGGNNASLVIRNYKE